MPAAIADCSFVLATTARAHDQAKPVVGAAEAAAEMAPRVAAGETVALVFGRERNGLENHEVALADRIVTLPVNPAFASLNLAQAVVIVGYEWFKLQAAASCPSPCRKNRRRRPSSSSTPSFVDLERELEKVEFFRPAGEARHHADQPAQHFSRAWQPTQQDIRTLHGVIMAIAKAAKDRRAAACSTARKPRCCARLSPSMAPAGCRASAARCAGWRGLLRRNPTEAERALWQALVNDRRFAGRGFKRQVRSGRISAISFRFRSPA